MNLLQALVLGVVQGLTEFLPISSSAHLIIVPWLAGWESFGLAFDVALHMGTLIAVLSYFRHQLLRMAGRTLASWRELRARRWPTDPDARLGIAIILGTIPAAVIGLLVEDTIDRVFHSDDISSAAIVTIALVLVAIGMALAVTDRRFARQRRGVVEQELTLPRALLVGLLQSLALIPGASRSGSTIAAGLLVGLSRPAAARFSFLLGVPLIAGAGVKQGWDLLQHGTGGVGWDVFLVGMVSAAVVGYLAIAGLLRFLERRSVDVFVAYRIALGLLLLGLIGAGVD